MPSIWLWGSFGVALGGLAQPFCILQPSSVSKTALYCEARRTLQRRKVIPGESPMYARRISHDSPMCLPRAPNRFGLCNRGVHGRVQIWDNPIPHHPKCPSSTPRLSLRLAVGCSCPVPFPPLRIRRAARLLRHRAFAQRLTQLVFRTAESNPNTIANNPCAAQVSAGKVGRMKDTVGLVFARRVMVN
jgi:hypothetical protein